MPSPPDPRKKITIRPPAGATHWCCWKVISKDRASGEKGRREKCKSEPGPDGKVPDAWPVEDFSTARVLEQWGDGKYRVDWYDANGERLKEHGELFDVATPRRPGRPAGPRLRPQAARSDEPDAAPAERAAQAIGAGGQMDLLTILTLLRQGEDAAEQRAQRSADRQMELLVRMQEQQTNLLARLSERPTQGADAELMRRELQQTMREQMFALRQELTRAPADDDEDDDEPDPNEPPADLTEAGERIAMSFLADLEKRAPEALPKVIEFLSRKAGVAPPAPNGRANGS